MRRKAPLLVAAVTALVAGGVCLAVAWQSNAEHGHLVPARLARVSPPPVAAPVTTSPTRPPRASPPPVPASVASPVMVQVPAVGLTAHIVPVGLSGDGQIDLPNPSLAGWYRLGPAPGAVGPAVLVGHVDSRAGPAVFYSLTAVRPGDEVDVLRADGTRSWFVISAVTVVKKAAFPTKAVFAPTTQAAIRLVTCTGAFNPSSGHYVDSLIAWGVATQPGLP